MAIAPATVHLVASVCGVAMISLRPAHVSRYVSIAQLLVKYGRFDLVHQFGLGTYASDGESSPKQRETGRPEMLARDLEQMGPTFIKLGQLLSTRTDLLPADYRTALERLQDDVEPIGFGIIERIVAEELGVRLSRGFREFDPTPLAAASIGQVHRAVLRDGRRVVVKVQRPDLLPQVIEDLAVLHELATVVDAHSAIGRRVRFEQIVESLREVMMRELNYCDEAENCRALRRNLREFELFYIPEVVDDYSSRRVLTSEFIEAAKFTTVSPVVLVELDRPAYADELFRVYLHQVLIDGLFHCDPHPGNIMLTTDRKIALIDFGMVARVTSEMQRRLVKFLLALGEGRAEEAAEEALGMGRPYHRSQCKEDEFRERAAIVIAANQGHSVEEIQLGRTVMEINAAAAESGLKLPSAVLLLGKTLMNLDKVVTIIDPAFNPQEAMRRHAAEIFRRHGRSRWSAGQLYRTMLDGVDFIERFPERMNKLADLAAHNKLKITVDAIDENRLIAGLQKIANRITTGLILASMILGASVMMRLEVPPLLFGYPLIALVFFVGAAAAAIVLLWRITFRDEPPF